MTGIMEGFPPEQQKRVTLANWRNHPYSEWAFSHVRELIPTADIPNTPEGVRALGTALEDLSHVNVTDGMSLAQYLDATWTDGYLVLQDGAIVHEAYRNALVPMRQHILMSVSKSMLGVLAGILAHKGKLDLAAPVTLYVPEVRGTAWNKATVQNVLDMRAGIDFNEDYEITSGPIIEYRKATGWNPLGEGEQPSDLRSFFSTLTESDGPHEGRFHYVSPNTDLAAWIIERATGTRYADLMSEHLWQPMGAGSPAYITVDRFGAPRAAGGMCVTLRDLARVGQLIADGGMAGTTQVIAPEWIEDTLTGGDRTGLERRRLRRLFPGPRHALPQQVVRGARRAPDGLLHRHPRAEPVGTAARAHRHRQDVVTPQTARPGGQQAQPAHGRGGETASRWSRFKKTGFQPISVTAFAWSCSKKLLCQTASIAMQSNPNVFKSK
jgi:CubicO group peptidase (beta-lactamase class C family)